jgi:PhoH-like ATPase
MDEYRGFQEITSDDERLPTFYSDLTNNVFDCRQNEHIIVYDADGVAKDFYRWDGTKYVLVGYKVIKNDYTGNVRPRNPQQRLAIDMLYNQDITVKILVGKFGTGKDYLMSSVALDLVMQGKFDKIMWVRNNVEVKNSKPLGFLPGDAFDKLLPFAMPLADHVGGRDGLERLISNQQIEVEHLGFIRGRDIKNTIIMCSEAENMTKEHIQLLLGRVGEGSALWLNGDYKQTDHKVFTENNGLMIAVDRLKGHPKFGFVKLVKTERSETAAMADLLD